MAGLRPSPERTAELASDGSGLVGNVRRHWVVHEDEALATQLQNNEFEWKYNRNCAERRQARQDVPIARAVQTDEELRLQREQMSRIQSQRTIIERDAVVAEQLQSAEMINKEQERIQRELKDQELARKLQHKERLRYELRKKEKELRKQRKLLERELQREAAEAMEASSNLPVDELRLGDIVITHQSGATNAPAERAIAHNGSLEDRGDFGDFYIEPKSNMSPEQRLQFQRHQDEELARLLQDQERRRGGGGAVNRDRLREIEDRDAELAHLIAEEEKLKRRRDRQHHRSHRHSRQTSDIGPSTPDHLPDGETSHRLVSSLPPSLSDGALRSAASVQRSAESSLDGRTATTDSSGSGGGDFPRSSTKYASRPLPETPRSNDANPSSSMVAYNASLARALDHDHGRNIEVIAEIVQPSGVRSKTQPAGRPKSEIEESRDIRTVPSTSCHVTTTQPPCENLFAAIDPTCNRNADQSSSAVQSSSPNDINAARRRAPIVVEDHYCDLDDIQKCLGGLDLVPGQRRSAVNRDNRNGSARGSNNCKQQ